MRSNRKYVRNNRGIYVPVEEEEEEISRLVTKGWHIEEYQGGILYADPRMTHNLWIPPEK